MGKVTKWSEVAVNDLQGSGVGSAFAIFDSQRVRFDHKEARAKAR